MKRWKYIALESVFITGAWIIAKPEFGLSWFLFSVCLVGLSITNYLEGANRRL